MLKERLPPVSEDKTNLDLTGPGIETPQQKMSHTQEP